MVDLGDLDDFPPFPLELGDLDDFPPFPLELGALVDFVDLDDFPPLPLELALVLLLPLSPRIAFLERSFVSSALSLPVAPWIATRDRTRRRTKLKRNMIND